ncbi:MAG: O-antigen ligase family protein [Treponema sp.]|nr:O-antigen ligase family protein [Treponema sp.]
MNRARTQKNNYLIIIFSFCVLSFLPYISFFTESKLPKETLPVYLLMIFIPALSFLYIKVKISKNLYPFMIVWFSFVFEYWFSTMITTKSPYMYSSVVIWIMEILVIIYLTGKDNWHELFFKSIFIFSFVFMIAAVLQVFIPVLLDNINTVLYPKTTVATMRRLTTNGYYTGLSSYITYQCHNILPVIGLSFATILFKEMKRKETFLWFCICGLSMFSMIITNKRMPLAAMVLSLIICVLISIKNKKVRNRAIIIGIIMFAAFIVMILFTPYGEKVLERILESKGVGNEARGYLWSSAVKLWFRRPILGNGYNSFSEFSELSVHNSYLQVLCESGIIGFTLFLGIYYIPLFKTISVFNKINTNKYAVTLKIILFSTMFYQLFCVIHSFTESVFHGNSLFLPLSILSAVPYSIERHLQQEKVCTFLN